VSLPAEVPPFAGVSLPAGVPPAELPLPGETQLPGEAQLPAGAPRTKLRVSPKNLLIFQTKSSMIKQFQFI